MELAGLTQTDLRRSGNRTFLPEKREKVIKLDFVPTSAELDELTAHWEDANTLPQFVDIDMGAGDHTVSMTI
jgi:hypothetical protein